MNQNLSWITIVFFNKNTGNFKLLCNSIAQFLLLQSSQIKFYQLKFDSNNIQLTLSCGYDCLETLTLDITSHFGQSSLKDIFDFHIQNDEIADLERTAFPDISLEVHPKFKQELSDILLVILDEELTAESRISAAFHLHLTMIKELVRFRPFHQDQILRSIKISSSDFSLHACKIIGRLKEYKNSLLETAKELFFSPVEYKNRFKWVDRWSLVCNNEFKNSAISNTNRPDNIDYFINKLSSQINDQLGLNSVQTVLLQATIQYAISDLFFNKYLEKALIDADLRITELKENYRDKIAKVEAQLVKMDRHEVPSDLNEIRLFIIVRNESLRLPYFFKYYSAMGVDRFFLVDNGSDDNTIALALNQPKTHVFKTTESYKEHWDWIDFLLNKFGSGQWCFVVDADELFTYPFKEQLSLRQFISYLDSNRYSAVQSVLLDIYSDRSISETKYSQGENPMGICPYFDPQYTLKDYTFFDKKQWDYFDRSCYSGGVRANFFGTFQNEAQSFCLSKISLFKYNTETYLVQGMHAINGARISDITGVVFHSKFLQDFIFKAEKESIREEHFNNAIEYKNYKHHLDANKDISLKSERSVKYNDTSELINLKLMTVSEKFRVFFGVSKME